MQNAPAVIEAEYKVINIEDYAMTTDRVVKQVQLIQDVMAKVMHKDEHFGIIPGCEKPSLYKPGAEKLSVTFRLVPKYDISQRDMSNGHREYQVICTLIHAPTGQFFGQGVGSCTTMEGKYRYRNAEPEVTDRPVPKKFWDLRKSNRMNEAQELLGGKGFTTKKTDSGWFIAKKSGDKVEHDNPADYYNTVLKMAKKRAHVDAVLTATAASDLFTQDVEDMQDNGESFGGNGKQEKKADKPKTMKDLKGELAALMKTKGLSKEQQAAFYGWVNPKDEAEAQAFINGFDVKLQEFMDKDKAADPHVTVICPSDNSEVSTEICNGMCQERDKCPAWK